MNAFQLALQQAMMKQGNGQAAVTPNLQNGQSALAPAIAQGLMTQQSPQTGGLGQGLGMLAQAQQMQAQQPVKPGMPAHPALQWMQAPKVQSLGDILFGLQRQQVLQQQQLQGRGY